MAEGAYAGHDCGEQLGGGELGLFLVVVDVVVHHHLALGRLARLAGSQNDAHQGIVGSLADVLYEFQAGDFGFHHHVEQDDGNVWMFFELLACVLGRQGIDQLAGPAQHRQIAKRQSGDLVNGRFVVNHQNLPGRVVRMRGLRNSNFCHKTHPEVVY